MANLYYPAAFPEVIGVAALDNKGGVIVDPGSLTRAGFSNYGEDIVSVAAVGTNVETTVPFRPKSEVPYAFYTTRDYSRLNGTSFACPQVTGLAALILSKFPDLNVSDVTARIELNARSMGGPDTDGNGIDDNLGYGLIDAAASLGTAVVKDAIHENDDFLVGTTLSPLYNNDIFVVVRCKKGSDGAPAVSYFVKSTAENASIHMDPLPAHENTYIGRFHTVGNGQITIQVNGVLSGKPLQGLSFVYVIS
jgi:subtilisin family serine protease